MSCLFSKAGSEEALPFLFISIANLQSGFLQYGMNLVEEITKGQSLLYIGKQIVTEVSIPAIGKRSQAI